MLFWSEWCRVWETKVLQPTHGMGIHRAGIKGRTPGSRRALPGTAAQRTGRYGARRTVGNQFGS